MINDFEIELKRIMKTQIDNSIKIITAKVKSVDESNFTITVENNFLKKVNVPLKSLSVGSDKGIILIPKINSVIALYTQQHESIEYVRILQYNEIEKAIIQTDDVKIEVNTDNVNITAPKVYLNDDSESEPLLRGETTKTHIENLYDYIDDLYTQVTIAHTGNSGAPTVVSPTVIANSLAKQTEITNDLATTSQTLSTKNFTE